MSILRRVRLLVIPTTMLAALIAVQVALAHEPDHTVTGGGTFISSGFPRRFGVSARDSWNTDSGEFQMGGVTSLGQTFAFHADVTCVNVVGSVAYLGGTARSGSGSDGADATGKILRARLDEGSPDRATVSLRPVGTDIPSNCFASELTNAGAVVKGQIEIRVVPVP